MNIKNNIMHILENITNNQDVKEYWMTSGDNYSILHENIIPSHMVFITLINHLKEYHKYGECADSCPKGHWIKKVKFEIVSEERRKYEVSNL